MNYAVFYDGIIARVVKAGPEDIGRTYSEAVDQALLHMIFHRDTKAMELNYLNKNIERLLGE